MITLNLEGNLPSITIENDKPITLNVHAYSAVANLINTFEKLRLIDLTRQSLQNKSFSIKLTDKGEEEISQEKLERYFTLTINDSIIQSSGQYINMESKS